MTRAGAGLLAALVLLSSGPSPAQHPVPTDQDAEVARFLTALERLRGGEEAAAAELSESAKLLCALHGRCDSLDVARHYLALDAQARAQGLADELAFLALRARVVAAGADGDGAEQPWSDVRGELEDELLALAERVEQRPDFAPAARAYALLARLETARAARDSELDARARAAHLDAAEAHALDALALFARAGQRTPQLEPLWVLGDLARARGERALAQGHYERCLELATELDRDAFRELALLGLVALARDAGDVAAVGRLLAELARFRDPRDSWPLAREHARQLLQADRADSALDFLLRHPPAEPGFQDAWHALLAAAFLRAGDLVAARSEVDALSAARGELALLARAALALADGHPSDVLEELADERVLATLSAEGRAQACALLGEACLDLAQPAEARAWLERALAEARTWEARRATQGGSVVGEWIGLHAVVLLARARAALGDALGAAAALEEHQARHLRPTGAAALERDDVARWARSYEAGLVTWTVGADDGLVVHVDASGDAYAARLAYGRQAMAAAVRRLREAAVDGAGEQAAALGAEVARTLFPAELRARLARAPGGARVLLLLHGPLEGLPVALLSLDGQPIDERLTTLALPGLPATAPGPAPRFDGEWNLLGSPHGATPGAPLLPGASRELAHVARMRPGARLFVGSAFVRQALVDALRADAPLHVATHLVADARCGAGLLAPQGLLLSGGDVFCADEVLALAPRAPLVVLSACESGGGLLVDAEGMLGVARAFLASGTRDLLVTLWPVEDSAASAFAATFHAELLHGAPPALAARAARRALRDQGHPAADWAAFRLLGRD